jgi:hypothetical protein
MNTTSATESFVSPDDASDDAGHPPQHAAQPPVVPEGFTPPGTTSQRDWKTVLPFIVGLISFAMLAILNEVRDFDLWRNYALVGILLGGPSTYFVYRTNVRVPHRIQWVITIGLWFHYGGGSLGSPGPHDTPGLLGMHGINGAYHVFAWWDNLTHAFGMGSAAMAIAYTLEVYQLRRRLGWNSQLVAILAFTSALAVGVGVELYEFLGKTIFQTIDQGGYENTMWDIVWNMIGATIGTLYAVAFDRRGNWSALQRRWGAQAAPAARQLPPNMLGYIAFIAPAAVTSAFFGLRFLLVGDMGYADAYDRALTALSMSAAVGVVAAPIVSYATRTYLRRLAPDASP